MKNNRITNFCISNTGKTITMGFFDDLFEEIIDQEHNERVDVILDYKNKVMVVEFKENGRFKLKPDKGLATKRTYFTTPSKYFMEWPNHPLTNIDLELVNNKVVVPLGSIFAQPEFKKKSQDNSIKIRSKIDIKKSPIQFLPVSQKTLEIENCNLELTISGKKHNFIISREQALQLFYNFSS